MMTAEVFPNPGITSSEVLQALRSRGKPLQEWGRAVDGTPLLAARSGGDKRPAIFITAGSHSTETGGVHGALALLEMLDSEHEVHVLPLRDPLGFSGVAGCLTFATGRPVGSISHQGTLDLLMEDGRLVWRDSERLLFLLGDLGFLWSRPTASGVAAFVGAISCLLTLAGEEPEALRPLRGKRVLLLTSMPDVEGTEETLRCWQGVVSRQGEWLHLNRFFGRSDAPSEVAAVTRLMQTVRPGLTCDLHEGNGSGFWLPLPRPKEDPERAFALAQSYFGYLRSRGYPVTTYEEWVATDDTAGKNYTLEWMRPEPRLPGLFWCRGMLRGEGYNLIDYAGLFGLGFGTEAPMEGPLSMRVDGITHGTLAAIREWERLH